MKLRKPIILDDGSQIDELNFAWDALCYADLASAKRVKALVSQGVNLDVAVSPKLDTDLRIGIAWVAAMKADKRLALNDILKLSLVDSLELSDNCVDDYLI
jgi:hypothetical protein